ncbi:MAG: Maf family protein [Steroidobacteraceae bacterium]
MGYDSVVLASASKRRSLLLDQIGVRHRSMAADLDEQPLPAEKPADYVQRLARDKARAVVAALGGRPDLPVLAADTTVVLDGKIYGKPANLQDCVDILAALSGHRHEVLTAIALENGGSLRMAMNASFVTFRTIAPEECRRYWASGEPAGKAGAYAIQGYGAVFIALLEGSFSGVMGLPLFETAALLDAAGVRRWRKP